MKTLLIFSFFIFGYLQAAKAQVPYSSIDKLRSATVVVRVAADFPKSPKLKACALKEPQIAQLGAKLALQTENLKADWSKEHLYAADLASLKNKVKFCEIRGSCSAYGDFLTSVHGSEADVQKEMDIILKSVNQKLSVMKSQNYAKAWTYVVKPCDVLKILLK